MKYSVLLLIVSSTLFGAPAGAAEPQAPRPPDSAATPESPPELPQGAELSAALKEAEHARREAEAVRAEARQAAELAREAARRQSEGARMHAVEKSANAEGGGRMRASEAEEMARVRAELSRAHRELREASREIARAHRELAMAGEVRRHRDYPNLGDRAVIGVVLGTASDDGVELIAVTPDGPAEQAGLRQGDVLTAIADEDLSDRPGEARRAIFELMSEVSPGDTVPVTVLRDGERLEFAISAERREPRAWQSLIRLPPPDAPDAPRTPEILIERIEMPHIDEEALAERIREATEQIREMQFHFVPPDSEPYEFDEEFFDALSGLGRHALEQADLWFGLPYSEGLELARINEGLGKYFDAERGVLVLDAPSENPYRLQPGDVVLGVANETVSSPAEFVRVVRELETGDEIELRIKRDRRERRLKVTVPERRFSQHFGTVSHHP